MKYTNRNGPIQWQISTSIKVILEHFSLAFIVFKILDLEDVGQGHDVQYSMWRHSMANT